MNRFESKARSGPPNVRWWCCKSCTTARGGPFPPSTFSWRWPRCRLDRRPTPNRSAGPRPGRGQSGAAPAGDIVLHTRRSDLVGRTANQQVYLRNILTHDITFGIGPAGTGKTFLAVACAVDALTRSSVQRIILTRPAVEAGERLGFLPGDLAQKVDPYLRPLYDALYDLMGIDKVTRAFEKGSIEVAPLAFMRGRTLNNAFVILDEAQNTTPEQMKMFLTRIGFGAKAVVTGDVSQIDLPRGQMSGLIDAERVLRRVSGIATTRFTSADVVRHPLVARIVEAYDAARAENRLSVQVSRAAVDALAAVCRCHRSRRAAATQGDALVARGVEGAGRNHRPDGRLRRGPPAESRLPRPRPRHQRAHLRLQRTPDGGGRSDPVRAGRAARSRRAGHRRWKAHYAHLLVHGALHAQGMDHQDDAEAR